MKNINQQSKLPVFTSCYIHIDVALVSSDYIEVYF